MKKLLSIAFLALLGCGAEQKQFVAIINFDKVKEVPADLKIENVLLLETDTIELLGEDVKVQYSEEGFFIMNSRGGKGIHHFSPSGQHLGMAAQVGEAPGQIPQIEDFKLNGSSLLVISGRGNRTNLHQFSTKHRLETTIEIPHHAYSFQPLENGNLWFYGGYYIMAGDHRLFLTDASGKLKGKLLPNKERPIGEIGGQAFYQGDDRILFREPLKTTVWEITPADTLKEAYKFDFGSYTVPNEYWEQDLFEGFGKLMAKGFTDIFTMLESDRYFLADVITYKGMERSKSLFIRDKKSDNQFKIKLNQELGHFNSPIGIEGNQIMFFAYPAYLVRYKDQLNLSDEAKASLANLTEDSNPVILYAKIPG